MKEIVDKIVEKISFDGKDNILLDSEEDRFEIKKENFLDIKEFISDKKIAFVDGGNLEIFKAPSLSLFFNRIYYTVYQNNKRVKNNLFEFFTLISAVNKEGKIFFRAECFFTKNKLDLREYYFDSFDPCLVKGGKRAEISSVGDAVRRLAELSALNQVKADFAILDGTLETLYPYEEEILETVKIPFFSIAKTANLLTEKGNTATALLKNCTDKKTWAYHLGKVNKKNHKVELYFLKLNKKSDYVFRFEASSKEHADEVISLLKENSNDAIFLGYPYGLIDADMLARVSKKEKESLQLKLMVLLGKEGDKVKPYLNALNAHDILDSKG